MSTQSRACLFALGAALLWSTVATAFRLSLRHLEPVQLLAYAGVVSSLTLGALLVVNGRLGEVLRRTRRDYARSLVLRLINPFLSRVSSPHISPPFYYARRSALRKGAYSLQPARRSVSYAFAVLRSVPPSQRHLDALATNGGEICGLVAGSWG